MSEEYVVIFHSTHHALRAEKILKGSKLEAKMIPLPRKFSAECGLALKISGEIKSLAEKTLSSHEVEYKGIYKLD
ncbi:MAG: DUF3343 domain-containing protein [Actinomycetota bacterium]|nr:DUF3343 domain-containing protein [Actinomycetota bacterium]MDI6822683.1 DUF3343 domain-containing protein [Actinomycetota bacterium]